MIKNYFKISLRNITKNKWYSFITICGLTLGIWACMCVATVIIDDLSYDKQWSKKNQLFRINSVHDLGGGIHNRFAANFVGLGPALKQHFPEVEQVSKIYVSELNLKRTKTAETHFEVRALDTDTIIWNLLDTKIIAGAPKEFIHGKGNLIISEHLQKKLFPLEDPIGKTLYNAPSYTTTATPYIISGVIEDIPSNTHLRADAILITKGRKESLYKKQYGTFLQNYILMKEGTDMEQFTAKVNTWYANYVEVENPYTYEFQPIEDIYLHSEFAESQEVKGNATTLYILGGVALLILLIACVNFVNLSTARSIYRLPEIGVRKILGAKKHHVVFQFLTEAMLFFFFSTVLATFIYALSIPLIEAHLEHDLAQTFLTNKLLLGSLYGIISFIGMLTGTYPALIMSNFKAGASIKGSFFRTGVSHQNIVRKSLVVLQFSISIIVLIALIVVQQQVSYMKHKDIGFNKENLLSIGSISWDGKGTAFKNELLKNPIFTDASITSWRPTQGPGNMGKRIKHPQNPEAELEVWFIKGDIDLAKTLGLRIQEGRFFDASHKNDTDSGTNEAVFEEKQEKVAFMPSSLLTAYTAKVLQIGELNEKLIATETTPVGIIEDFNNESLKMPRQPTIIVAGETLQYGGMLIRAKPNQEKEAMVSLNALWKEFYPNKLLDIAWMEDMLNQQYKAESKLQKLFAFFSLLSMFLAALGIFGLVVQATARRVKEIGIRKVLGASVNSIVLLFSKDFIRLVGIAILFASPIAWYLMQKWLEDFAFRIEIEWWVFAISGITAILIALSTLTFQGIKAALASPAQSLRSQ